jgi:hypothetical protein
MSEPTKLDLFATRAVDRARDTWAALVDMSLLLEEDRVDGAATELSKHMGQSKDNLKRKILAIQHVRSLGNSADDIKKAGQGVILSRYIKARNSERYETTTVMKWNIPGSLREVIRNDMARVARVLGFVTSEQLWDFIHSILVDLNDDALKELAGEFKKEKTE